MNTTCGGRTGIFGRNFSGTLKKFISLGVCVAGSFFFNIPDALAMTDVFDSIDTDTTWTEENGPYVVQNWIDVLAGATLTIEPGVVVKFANYSGIDVRGKLVAEGAADKKIYFTSLADDSIGGDTNGDGAATAPSAGHGGELFFSRSAGSIIGNAVFKYANTALYFYRTSAMAVHDIEITDADDGITVSHGEVNIAGARLSHILSDGISGYYATNLSVASSTIENVVDGDAFGFYGSTFNIVGTSVENIGDGSAIGMYDDSAGSVSNSRFATGTDSGIELYSNPPYLARITIEDSTISGYPSTGLSLYGNAQAEVSTTTIKGNGDGVDLYGDGTGAFSMSGSAIYGNELYGLYNNSATSSVSGNWWGDPSGPYNVDSNPDGLGNEVYGNVVFAPWLTEDPTLPPAKPDPVIIIPGLLGSARKNGVWTIDPIFHVYDDLIDTLKANGYIEGKDLFTFPYDWELSNVDTAIFLGSKIAAVRALCSCAKVDLVAHSMGGLVAREYIESPAYAGDIDQLIFLGTPHLGAPKDYLTWEAGESTTGVVDRYIKNRLSSEAKKAGYSSLFNYIHSKPIPSFQEILPVTDYLRDKATATLRTYPVGYPSNIFLENLNDNVSSLLNSGVRITNIVGDTGTSTITSIRVASSTSSTLWTDGIPDGFGNLSGDQGLELGKGDETVSLLSAEFINSDINVGNFAHTKLPTKEEGLVYKKLTNKDAQILVERSQILRILGIKILSPADIVVVAPDGKRVGKDFATGDELNEIDGAFYSGYATDDEYVTIPNPIDGDYKVIAEGTGSGGEYTVAAGLISDQTTAERDFVGQTLPGMITPIDIAVSSTSPDALLVKPEDSVSPAITIISPEKKDYLRSEKITINATSTDAGSGVFSFGLSLDGKMATSGELFDPFFDKLGIHALNASSTDFVGNFSTSSVAFRVVATPESVISDIERAFSLGLITKKRIKDSLVRSIKEMVRLEKREDRFPERRDEEHEKDKKENKIIKKIEKIEKKIDKELARELLKELKELKKGNINLSACNLLKEDIEWLVANY